MTRDGATRERWSAWVLGATLLAAVLAALFGRALPAPKPWDAPPTDFAAERALRLLQDLARAPHPVGSAEHERVERRLFEALGNAGLAPQRQVTGLLDHPLTNLLAWIPGRAPTGTLLLLAHYDSVPSGPGAGDDGVGVVAWVEALRALGARGWQPRNDVLLLLSDGEELGLLGAQAFAQEHPLAAGVRTVVNLEAIGNGGPAVLFQLGPDNGPRVRAFAAAVPAPTGTSLADAVYRVMPNDTDLSVFLWRGIGGFNLALTSGSSAYHAPHDTPANLDPRSLQHMGECALALAQHLGEADLTALDGPDVTFFDLLGRVLIVTPRAFDWTLLGLGLAALLAALRSVSLKKLARGTHLLLLDATGMAMLVALIWWALDAILGLFGPQLDWVAGNTTTATLALLGLIALVTGRAVRRAREREAVDRAGAGAALLLLAALAALGTWKLPGAAFALSWPLLLLALAQAVPARTRAAAIALPLTLAATLVLTLPIAHLLLQLFWRTPVAALALTTAAGTFLATACAPHAWSLARLPRDTGPRLLQVGLALLAASAVIGRLWVWRQGSFLP